MLLLLISVVNPWKCINVNLQKIAEMCITVQINWILNGNRRPIHVQCILYFLIFSMYVLKFMFLFLLVFILFLIFLKWLLFTIPLLLIPLPYENSGCKSPRSFEKTQSNYTLKHVVRSGMCVLWLFLANQITMATQHFP